MNVVIVGGNIAGLRCAELLSNENINVEVFEKGTKGLYKICAAGYTKEAMNELLLPDYLIERDNKYVIGETRFGLLKIKKRIYMLSRPALHEYQWDVACDAGANVHEKSQVVDIDIKENTIELDDSTRVKYDYLIGADGSNSIVRKKLNLPFDNQLVLQYRVPEVVTKTVQMWFPEPYYYTYTFPHDTYTYIGCGIGKDHKKLKKYLEGRCKELNIDTSDLKLEAFPINLNYSGMKFKNIYLVGDAVGFASRLTGEGISQALTSARLSVSSIFGENEKYETGLSKMVEQMRRESQPYFDTYNKVFK